MTDAAHWRAHVALAAVLSCLGTIVPEARAQLTRADSLTLTVLTIELLNAIANGDAASSARHLAPSWFITDNEGRRLTRAEFLREVRTVGSAPKGRMRLNEWHVVGTATVAVVSYTIDEESEYRGQHVRTRQRSTDTYIRENGRWLMLASHISALPTTRRTRRLPRRLHWHRRTARDP
jgi:hypothetical protein